jgi:hypothetical protein
MIRLNAAHAHLNLEEEKQILVTDRKPVLGTTSPALRGAFYWAHTANSTVISLPTVGTYVPLG